MISSDNQPVRATTTDEDFTEAHYRQLLRTARSSYRFATYDAIPWGTRFILWRHDLDLSINRAAALADIESEEGVTATYFINPRSEYYNPFEPKQAQLLRHILGLGHRLGLHFDASITNVQTEEHLHKKVAQERRWLEETFGVRMDAFSFHNPAADELKYDADQYGGLPNCYSRRLKSEVPYCSDSNGYWRFRRLHDVLVEAKDPCLQVLTHPGFWQERPLPPRQRIFRCAHGRAVATMRGYDKQMLEHNRINHSGFIVNFDFLRSKNLHFFTLCDYLWNQGHLESLFIELWRIHKRQIKQLCVATFQKDWLVSAAEVNAFFKEEPKSIDNWKLFSLALAVPFQDASKVSKIDYEEWVSFHDSLINCHSLAEKSSLENGCSFLCAVIKALAEWGKAQPMRYDGIETLNTIGISMEMTTGKNQTSFLVEIEEKTSKLPNRKWQQFKVEMQKISISERSE